MQLKKIFQKYSLFVSVLLVLFLLYLLRVGEREVLYIYNADFLHIALFSESFFSDFKAYEYWYITPSPYLFPDIILFGIINLIINNLIISYSIYLLINFISINWALKRLYELFFSPNLYIVTFHAIIIFVLFQFSDLDSYLYLNQLVPVNHLSAFILFVFLLKKKIMLNKGLVLWFFVIVLMSFSDPVFAIYFIPTQFFLLKGERNIFIRLSPIIASLLGLFLFRISYSSAAIKAINEQKRISWHFKDSIYSFIQDIDFLLQNTTFVVFLLFIAFSLLYIVLRRKNWGLLLYILLGVPFIEIMAGFIMGIDTFRYFTGSLFFGSLVGFSMLLGFTKKYMNQWHFHHQYIPFISILSIIILYVYAFSLHFFELKKPTYIQCLQNTVKAKNVDYIIANYWITKPIIFLAGFNALQFDENVHPYKHEFNTRLYQPIIGNDSLVGLAFLSNFNRDSLNVYIDQSVSPIPCGSDTLFILNKSPLR